MKCEDCLLNLEELIDGELDGQPITRHINDHLGACAECQSAYQSLSQEQELYSRYNRDLEVSPALWNAVQARIKQPEKSPDAGFLGLLLIRLNEFFRMPQLSPAFAMLLVFIAVGITAFVAGRHDGNKGPGFGPPIIGIDIGGVENTANNPKPTEGPKPAGPQNTKLASAPLVRKPTPTQPKVTPEQLVHDAEQKYLTAIEILSRDVNRRRSELDPQLIARIDRTLDSIDRTIADTREVVRNHPGDPVAVQYLLTAYAKKVEILREVAGAPEATKGQPKETPEGSRS